MIRRPRRFALTFALLILSACEHKVQTTTPTVIVAVEPEAEAEHQQERWYLNPKMADDDLLCAHLRVDDVPDGELEHCALASEVRHFIVTRKVAE